MNPTSCPDRQVLLDYHTGRLAEAIASDVIAHISSCPTCQATVKTFGDSADSLVARLRRAKPEDPYAHEPQRRQMLDRVKALAETIVLRESPSPQAAREPVALGSLGDYELLQKLGEGGMGAVYKARHTRLDKLVAVKVLPSGSMHDPAMVARFEREMKAVGKLDHPHIVRAMDAGQIGGRHYLAMEYVDGLDLSEVVQRCGPLRIADACEVVRQAALGLRYADEHTMVHRDIKPSNLVLDVDGQVKILDLGLALLLREVPAGDEISSTSRVVGTLDYIAPEQCWDSHDVDIRADIYSLGCTFYKILTGQAPFADSQYRSSFDKMMAHVQVPAPPLRSLRKEVPEKLAAVVERMMAKSREDRYPLPGQVVEALQPYCSGSDLTGLMLRARKAVQTQSMPAGSPAAPATASSASPEAGTAPPARPPQLLVPPSLPTAAKKPAAEEPFDPYRKWFGIPPEEQPPNHYRLLGIPLFEEDRDVIQSAAAGRSAHLKNMVLGKHQAESQRLLNEVQRAKICLVTPADKVAYDAHLRRELQAKQAPPPTPPMPPALEQPAGAADPLAFLETTPPASEKRPGGRWGRRKPSLPVLIGAAATAAVVLLGVIVYVVTNKGTVKIELSDPTAKVEVKIDGSQIDVAGLKEPLSLSVGEHALEVTSGDFKTVSTSFSVHRGRRKTLAVTLEPKPHGNLKEVSANERHTEGLPTVLNLLPSPTDLKGWYVRGADTSYSYEKGVLTISSGPLVYPIDASDMIIRAKVKKLPGQNLELHLRRSGKGSYLAWFNGGNWFGMGKELSGEYRDIAWTGTAQRYDGFFEFAFGAVGDRLTAYVNGEPILHAGDKDLLHGQPGLRAARGRALFSDVRLEVLDSRNRAKSNTLGAAEPRVAPKVTPRSYSPQPTRPSVGGTATPLAVAPFDEKKAKEHQEAWAKHLGVPVEITNSIRMKLVLIPPGKFTIGSETGMDEEKPAHEVTITEAFYLGECEVTQAQYEKVMGSNPSKFKGSGPDAPVEQVRWHEAVAFCERLSRMPGEKTAGGPYRLPTEAEWEYSARAGTRTAFFFGDDEAGLSDYAWRAGNSDGKTHPVRQKRPNAFGLFDVHGNVWEWCADWYGADYYQQSTGTDPVGPQEGTSRVLRGGAWNSVHLGYFRSAGRFDLGPDYRSPVVGFRVARTPTPATSGPSPPAPAPGSAAAEPSTPKSEPLESSYPGPSQKQDGARAIPPIVAPTETAQTGVVPKASANKLVPTNPIRLASSAADMKRWDASNGKFRYLKGAVTIESGRLVYPGNWRDVMLRAKVKNISAHRFMLGVRFDAERGSYLGWLNQGQWFGIGKQVGKQFIEREQVPATNIGSDFVELSLAAVRDVVSLSLDGRKILCVRDPGFGSGGVSLEVYEGSAIFKDIEVQPIDPANLTDAQKELTTPSWAGNWIVAPAATATVDPSGVPITGEIREELLALDEFVVPFVRDKRCTSAMLSVERNGSVCACRGYGWQDRSRTRPVNPFTRMHTLAYEGVFAKAAAGMMLLTGKLTRETPVFKFLGVRLPRRTVVDNRVWKITIQHAMESRLGWDEKHAFGALYQELERRSKSQPPTIDEAIPLMLQQPLQFEPGDKHVYDCFSWLLLYKAAEKAAGKDFGAVLREAFEECGPTHMAPTLPENAAGDEEVFYAYQQKPGWANFDRRHAMSAVDLNRFLRFWGRDGQWSGGRGGSYGFWFWQCGELTVDSDRWPDGFSMVFMCNGQVDSRGLAQRIRKVLDDRGNGIR